MWIDLGIDQGGFAVDLFNYFLSDLPGAPQLQRQPGSLIEVLDAALVTGLGLTVVNQISAAAGVVTIKVTGQPVALPQGLIELAGVGGALAGLNGVHRVQEVGADTITIHAAVADAQSAAAGMTVRIPPLGWRKKFADGHVAVYDSPAPVWQGAHLRVDDSDETFSEWRGYGAMTDVSTGEGEFPSSGRGVLKFKDYSGGTRRWLVFGDDKFFAVRTHPHHGSEVSAWAYFGLPDAIYAGDVCATVFCASDRDGRGCGPVGASHYLYCLGDSYGQMSGGTPAVERAPGAVGDLYLSGRISWLPGVRGIDPYTGQLFDNSVYLCEASGGRIRGRLPGMRHIPHEGVWSLFSDLGVITMPNGARRLFVRSSGDASYSNQSLGAFFVEIDDWRVAE